jgi:hypothetical protein
VSAQHHAPATLPLDERVLGIHWIGDWVGPRAGLDDAEKIKFFTLPGLELRPIRRPARSQPLYRLSYLDSHSFTNPSWYCFPFKNWPIRPRKLAQAITLDICIRDMPGSILGKKDDSLAIRSIHIYCVDRIQSFSGLKRLVHIVRNHWALNVLKETAFIVM